ncbi:MAG: hypothetical protein HY652_13655 [Acidobacteria bacterium]|nr:hypothetical protein [Acidobacteriota bacterium]
MRHCSLLMTLLVVVISLGQVQLIGQTSEQPFYSQHQETNDIRSVILTTQRKRRLHVFDASTLERLGYFTINDNANSVTATPDGRRLFIAQGPTPESDGCCALFVLDLATGAICKLIDPSSLAVTSPDGRWLFTQRGAVGIEIFDASTLARLPIMDAPGFYRLLPSPDGRWMFGTTNWRGPSLDVFDLEKRTLVRRLALPRGSAPRGAWLDEQFYLYAHDHKQGNLWKVKPETTELDVPVQIALPDLATDNKPLFHELIVGGERLFLYEPFGHKLDRRHRSAKAVPGGIFAIEPSSGNVIGYWTSSVHFHQVMASSDGRHLYGLDSGPLGWRGPVRLLKLDATSGTVLAERLLENDVWFMALARLPKLLAPHGEVQPKPYGTRCKAEQVVTKHQYDSGLVQ